MGGFKKMHPSKCLIILTKLTMLSFFTSIILGRSFYAYHYSISFLDFEDIIDKILLMLTLAVHCSLCLKYKRYLCQIRKELKSDNHHLCLQQALEKYKILYKLFKFEYTNCLHYALIFCVLDVVIALWLNTLCINSFLCVYFNIFISMTLSFYFFP